MEDLTGTTWQEKKGKQRVIDILEDDGGNWVKIKKRGKGSKATYKTRGRLKSKYKIIG